MSGYNLLRFKRDGHLRSLILDSIFLVLLIFFSFSSNASAENITDNSRTVEATVPSVNQSPELDLISDITVTVGEVVTLNPSAADPDGDTLSYSYSGWMTESSYTPTSADVGVNTVTVSDGELADSQEEQVC